MLGRNAFYSHSVFGLNDRPSTATSRMWRCVGFSNIWRAGTGRGGAIDTQVRPFLLLAEQNDNDKDGDAEQQQQRLIATLSWWRFENRLCASVLQSPAFPPHRYSQWYHSVIFIWYIIVHAYALTCAYLILWNHNSVGVGWWNRSDDQRRYVTQRTLYSLLRNMRLLREMFTSGKWASLSPGAKGNVIVFGILYHGADRQKCRWLAAVT